ncbi:MAG TPA: hypothetical protein VIX87_07450 [Steroidobacteraceae bacterium]
MKGLLIAALFAAFASGPLYADCAVPDSTVQIPDGATATKEEMIAAHKAVEAFNVAVKAYSDCLAQEQADKVAAGGDKIKLQAEYAGLNNAQVDKVQALADKFNTELKAYNAAKAGS